MRLGTVTLGLSASLGRVVPGTVRQVTFGGVGTGSITAGGELYSDPIGLAVGAGSDLVISTYLPGPTGPATHHALSRQINVVVGGDRTTQTGSAGFGSPTTSWYDLSGVDVRGSARSTVVAVGDSITDGYASTAGRTPSGRTTSPSASTTARATARRWSTRPSAATAC